MVRQDKADGALTVMREFSLERTGHELSAKVTALWEA